MAFVCKNCGKKNKGRYIRDFCDRTCQERFETEKVTGPVMHFESNVAKPRFDEIAIPVVEKDFKKSKKK